MKFKNFSEFKKWSDEILKDNPKIKLIDALKLMEERKWN